MSTSSELSVSATRRWVIAGLFVLAILTGFGALLTTWVKRQALDTNNWTNTSSKLLANDQIRNTVGLYLTDQLFTKVDVAAQLQDKLPARADALAGPAAAGIEQLAGRAAPELLARPRVQDAWRAANRTAHKQLIRTLEGGGNVVSTTGGNVVLNLHPLVDQLAAALGLEKQVANVRAAAGGDKAAAVRDRLNIKPPASSGQLVIMRSDQLATAQDVANGIKGLSILLTIISLGLFAIAIWIAHPARRVVVRAVGWSFVGIGLATLLARRVIGNNVVDGLVQSESIKPAAHEAWLIGTSLLYTIAVTMVIFGALLVASAWLTGHTRPAVEARRRLAPVLRDRPVLVYGSVACVYLLVLVWGPTPAFRNLIPILLIAGVIVLGVETLRHQTAREFPGEMPGRVGPPTPGAPPGAPALGHG